MTHDITRDITTNCKKVFVVCFLSGICNKLWSLTQTLYLFLGIERMYPGAYAQNERWIVCICGKMVMLNKPRASNFFRHSKFLFSSTIQSLRLVLLKYCYFI